MHCRPHSQMKITSQLHALAILTLCKVPAVPTGFEPLNIPEKKRILPFLGIKHPNVLHMVYHFTDLAVRISQI